MQTSKLKTLRILQMLQQYSDEENPLSATDLIERLQKDYGIRCERKSIYADIKALQEVGFDVCRTDYPRRGFYMAGRTFELAEVRMLMDAVQSAGFITPKKTEKLVQKLESLLSAGQAESLVRQVYCQSENKCSNEEIYYIIDNLHQAICDGCKVKFAYKRRAVDPKNKKTFREKIFTVSPYALIWKDDHYYLVCNNEKYDNLMNLRLDRMRRITPLSQKARPVEEVSAYKGRFDTADYAAKMFNMFSGETATVRLLCKLDTLEEMVDRFGTAIPIHAVDGDHFETTISAAVSEGMVSWLMQYGGRVQVLEPQSLINSVRARAETVLSAYAKE